MNHIITERSEGLLRVELNRPEKPNAMTSSMYTKLADMVNDAAADERDPCRALARRRRRFQRGQRFDGLSGQSPRPRSIAPGTTHECARRFRQAAYCSRARCRD